MRRHLALAVPEPGGLRRLIVAGLWMRSTPRRWSCHSSAMDPVEALRELGGVATFGELMGLTTRPELAEALAADRIHKPRHNRYTTADLRGHLRVVAKTGGTTSHLSAAQEFGWKLKADRDKPCTTVVACARAYDFDVALSVADSALREGIIDQDDLLLAAARSPRTGRNKVTRVARAASGARANPFESCLFAIASAVPGLSIQPQGHVPGVGYVDGLDRVLGIVVEAESLEFHGSKAALQRDVDRYTKAARLGLVVARFTWPDVMYRPDEVHQALAEVVRWRTKQAVGCHGLSA